MPRPRKKLGEFAWNLGMAFQLIDGRAGFHRPRECAGQSRWVAIYARGKVTLPLVYALESATPAERRLVETVLEQRNYQRVPFAQILALVERYDGNRPGSRARPDVHRTGAAGDE